MITDTGIAAAPMPFVLAETEPAPPTPRERNQRLLDRIRNGDKAAATEMMEANVPFVYSIVKRMMDGYTGPEGRARDQANEELVERGMDGLCEGVDHIVRGYLKHDNVTGYLAKWIEGAMCRPDDGIVECLPEDRKVELMTAKDWAEREAVEVPSPDEELMKAEEDIEAEKAYQAILGCCKGEVDRRIVELRREGRTIEEIMEELHLTATPIHDRLRKIRERLKKSQGKSR
jgi:RNA polymerase sigma factor (sigma-70 family)